jgi:hypothetical protein
MLLDQWNPVVFHIAWDVEDDGRIARLLFTITKKLRLLVYFVKSGKNISDIRK